MLVKSNSVPNFLFENEKPKLCKPKQGKTKSSNLPKIIPYIEFPQNKIKREPFKTFYDTFLHK
jgi:hypothetical protein